jgi:hypothetical protein
VTLIVMSALGTRSMKYISLKDGIAINTRITTGTTVHRISMTGLCEVRVGSGWRV